MFFLLTVILIATIFVYLKVKYFTFHGPIPGQSPRFILGNLLEMGQLKGEYMGDGFKQFQSKFGDTFQVQIGLLHVICVCNPDDVQHVFTHRHIYEQGNLHVDQHRLVLNDALICTMGESNFVNNFTLDLFYSLGHQYKRHASVVLPLFRRGKVINNLDLIIDCTDKLIDQWRSVVDRDPEHIHCNIVDQCQNLSLAIFGFLGFNYDLQTLEESNINKKNKLTQALHDFLDIFIKTTRLPNFLSKLYLKFNSRYRQSRSTIEEYLYQIIEQEQGKTPEETAAEKRTSLIASLITSIQQDEQAEARKPEQERKGRYYFIKSILHFRFLRFNSW